ncbi:hypothetical protein QTP88_008534 [Uroleucon formosanum]
MHKLYVISLIQILTESINNQTIYQSSDVFVVDLKLAWQCFDDDNWSPAEHNKLNQQKCRLARRGKGLKKKLIYFTTKNAV